MLPLMPTSGQLPSQLRFQPENKSYLIVEVQLSESSYRNESVKARMKLCCDVGRITHHTEEESPLYSELSNDECWQEDTRHHKGAVDCTQRDRSQ